MVTVALTHDSFDATIAAEPLVLVDVWATWCGPCRRFAPVFEHASQQHPDAVFGKVDADAEPGLARRLRVRGIPTLIVYRDGVEVRRKLGALSPAGLERLIEEARAASTDGDGAVAPRGLSRLVPAAWRRS